MTNPYQAADGKWFMLATSSAHRPGLARAIGHPELFEDARYVNFESFVKNSASLAGVLDAEFRARPFAHNAEILAGVGFSPAEIDELRVQGAVPGDGTDAAAS